MALKYRVTTPLDRLLLLSNALTPLGIPVTFNETVPKLKEFTRNVAVVCPRDIE